MHLLVLLYGLLMHGHDNIKILKKKYAFVFVVG